MLFSHLSTFIFASTALALLPHDTEDFKSSKLYKVNELQEVPKAYKTYIQKLESSPSSNKIGIAKAPNSPTSKFQNTSSSNPKTLNLSPGITTLHTDDLKECYFVNTTIGNTEYPLIIDTGSAYLWVYGDNCTDEACKDEEKYSSSESSESSSATSTFALSYVTGTAQGEVVEDNIIVNKLATTQKFKFGKADKVPDFFKKYPVSGIFGLPSNDSSAIQSIISALYDSHAIAKEIFSISLGNFSNTEEHPNSGIFAIGEPLEELYEGDIHYTDLIDNDSHYWLIPVESVSLDQYEITFNQSVDLKNGDDNTTTARKALVDSGTTVLALPKQDALDIHSYFDDSITDGSNFAVLCNSTVDLVLKINGQNWTLGPEYYLGEEYHNSTELDGYCVSNIQGIDTAAADSWILGATFLQSVYAVFDVDQQRVGFAEKNTNVKLTSNDTTSNSVANNGSSISTSLVSNSSSASTTSHKGGAVIIGAENLQSYTLFVALISMFLL
ncbi:putative cathepsin [Wickerhamomyces ciferrii]|uniref:Cathepsin n=1 Tax=Wickerhamomyces ciferrii (strain ATCC 14091 / BCRC 22168 / CBS 111 / JCM 3599 / NBRC 0793 / NRRL Y-1031 F-60-10) TaxID=1206466 RepID=K0KY28_WICCF|nr:putative cathepsin [Wickerhamomyces ciferrii]CCH46359.1 putative cathepsin [Wickerhamomyces ciferrii]